jgi:hypothetical protein
MSYNAKVYRKQGGNELVVASGGSIDIESGGALEIAGVAITATAAEINQAADVSGINEVVTTTNVIAASENGATYYLNAAAGFLSTLPAPALGLKFRFVVQTAPTSNGYTIATTTSANIIKGMMLERAGTAGVAASAGDLVTFVANQSIAGDWCEFWSDGTSWFIHGMVDVAAGVTIGSTA